LLLGKNSAVRFQVSFSFLIKKKLYISPLETPSALQTRSIYPDGFSYTNLPIPNDISNRHTSDSINFVRSTSVDSSSGSPKRLAPMISRQHQSIDNTTITPPPVPPRPNKALIRERLLYNDSKKNLNEIDHESIDEKKENRYNKSLDIFIYIFLVIQCAIE
jgi:hypothetical protein